MGSLLQKKGRYFTPENISTVTNNAYAESHTYTLTHKWCLPRMEAELAKTYPLLAQVLKESGLLPLIKDLSAVLAWHAVLFEALPPNTLTRDEASALSNEDVVDRLPKDRRAHAKECLGSYCEAFNRCLPYVANLHECQANPFLAADGSVDLTGTRSGGPGSSMSHTTPVSFSLPSVRQGEADAQGLCTLQTVALLQRTHNETLWKLSEMHGVASVDGLPTAPQMTYSTPQKLVTKRLITYDPEQDLLPLIHIHAQQALEVGEGGNLEYDWKNIQDALADRILVGKGPINIHVRHFQFAGELHQTGRLAALKSRIKPRELGASLRDSIWAEVDTQNRLSALSTILEQCVSFLAASGGGQGQIDGQTMLQDYVLHTLAVPGEVWEQASTSSIAQHITLAHIAALVTFLEEQQHGNPADRILLKYCSPLTEVHRADVTASMPLLRREPLLQVMKECMVEQLTKGDWPAERNLREYLVYFDMDLEDEEWFEHFPESLQLMHTAEAYRVFSAIC
eukprot:NODE_10_length_4763_cov_24.408782_g9_i0.p1 GENE.NODE_10_length_4763_cov_24.408782_g9_i0~~NODE_10_length_4763_cov_24.408782_g9_i0.p1  ORF type:complete len:510 (+),score=139.43 NODE_10_length_4763_cov_24.408782_g9_i0:3189-4718(+)